MAREKGKTSQSDDSAKTGGTTGRTVLVGTYKGDQLTKWRGWYNYPVSAKDKVNAEDAAKVNELWLFKGTKEQRTYKAEFVGVKTRDELVRGYGYPAKGKAHGDKYLLFKTEFKYRHKLDNPLDCERVIVRAADFATAPKVRKQLKAYLESPDRHDPDLAKRLPSIITQLRPEQLRVCEAAVQLEFLNIIFPERMQSYARLQKTAYRVASLFAGCGGLDLGFVGGFSFLGKEFRRNNFDIVWANELSPNACKTYKRNLDANIICGDIKDAIASMPTDVDVIMGGFPCQDISINGKMIGIKGKRSSLYSYIVEAVRKCRPKVFLAENVGSLMLKQNEYSFKTILADFESPNYNVTYNVYHAEQYGVPQIRGRMSFVERSRNLMEAA